MRILFFSNVYPNPPQPQKGTFNRSMIRGLSAQHRVRVVSPVPWVDEARALIHRRTRLDRVTMHFVDGVRAEYPRFCYPPGILRSQFGRWMWWSVARELRATIETFRPDVLLSYWTHPDGEVAVRAAREAGIPSVVITGGSDVLLLARQPSRRRAIARVLQSANTVVTVSEDIARHVRDLGVNPARVATIQRGVDSSVFFPGDMGEARRRLEIPETGPVLVAAGRLVPVKGFSVLIDACHQLRQSGLDFTCYVLGEGPLRGELEQQISSLGLKSVVRLVGSQQQSRLADWYRAATCTVLPSRSEGIPNVLLEAMSCGGRFVASNVGGVGEIADAELDCLVPPDDPTALAAGIEIQLTRPQSSGSRRVLPQTSQEAATELKGVLDDVCRQSWGYHTAEVSQLARSPVLEVQ